MTIISCGLWLSILILVAFAVDRLFVNGIKLGAYRFFVGPAALVHNISQVLACLLTGAHVKSVKLADAKTGRVEHEKPKLRGLGEILIAVAPLIACGAILMLMPSFFRQPLSIAPMLPKLVDTTPDAFAGAGYGLLETCKGAVQYLWTANYTLPFAAFLYVGLIFTIGLTPDKGKLLYALFAVAAFTGGAYFLDGKVNHSIERFTINVLWVPLSFAVPLALIFLGLAILLAVLANLLISKKKPSGSAAPAGK
jgi:hypothetical protein